MKEMRTAGALEREAGKKEDCAMEGRHRACKTVATLLS